jgi:hypothetical protein
MFGDGGLSFREFIVREPHPLAVIHDAVLEFLRGRDDAALYGAQAVNAYIDEPRMTQDVDIMSPRAEQLAEEIRTFLNHRFHIAVRVRNVREGLGFRIYQVQKPKNRHLVDVRPVASLPPSQRVDQILVISPDELICEKVLSMIDRSETRKQTMDLADLQALLVAFPNLKTIEGAVADRLREANALANAWEAWRELVGQDIRSRDEDDPY